MHRSESMAETTVAVVPSIAFQYTLWSACASVLRQLLLDLGLQYSFNILKSNYLCSPELYGWLSELTTLSESQTTTVTIKISRAR